MKEEWFVTRELVEEIRADMAEHVGFGASGLDRQIEQSLAGLDAKHLDSVVTILGIAALIVKRLANERGREEDEAQEKEHRHNEMARGLVIESAQPWRIADWGI